MKDGETAVWMSACLVSWMAARNLCVHALYQPRLVFSINNHHTLASGWCRSLYSHLHQNQRIENLNSKGGTNETIQALSGTHNLWNPGWRVRRLRVVDR